MSEISKALENVFTSPNVADSNMEPANIVDVVDRLGRQIVHAAKLLGNGDAATPMGALEAHGKALLDASDKIAAAIHDLADAIRETKTI